ncbi:hypothetical protein P8452_34259 [Trifolium repens]|nr:hypothetical protein P8452_34259 [Trifolium repens]
MEVLKDRCLIFISEYYEVGMHDLIKEMGQDIVLLEDDPRKRSRLWKPNDIYDVLSKKKGKGTDAIKGIFLDMMEIKKIQLDADTFNEMHNLRMIIFRNDDSKSNVTCSDDLKFPNNLKLLYWDCFPQRSLPQDSWPENLIAVKMRHSHLEQLWEGDLALPNLKILDLSYSEKLRAIPDLSLCPNIDEIRLYHCENLEELPEVKEETMKNLKRLWLGGTAIKELPSSLDRLVGLEELSLLGCRKLKTIPSSIGNLSKLVRLDLSYCSNLDELPEIMETMENLEVLNLDETSIKELPSSLHHLVGLVELSLESCRKLKTIPSSIGNLSKLLKLNLAECESLETFPEIPNYCLSSLTELWLQGSSIVNLPESMAHLSSLKLLYLTNCKLLECVPKLPPNLSEIWALDCPSIKRMMLSSRSDSEEGTFQFYLTNSQELDATSWSNIREEACIKINDHAYRSVFFCFPGSAVPDWFLYSCKGHSVTVKEVSPNLCSKNRLIGFALCAIWRPGYHGEPKYKFGFTSDGKIYSSDHNIPDIFGTLNLDHTFGTLNLDHTLLWKHQLDLETIGNKLFHAQNFTFEFPADVKVKECGICPLYTKRIDDNRLTKRNKWEQSCRII